MASQPDMFPTAKPPRAKPRVLMHFTDAGYSSCGTMATFKCDRCGYESEWMDCRNDTEVKRGLPCPNCNKETP